MFENNSDITNLIQEARTNIENKQYWKAIENLDYILERENSNAHALFLRGKSYSQLHKYKLSLTDLESALDIYRETENKRWQVHTLMELTFIYMFNGKTKEGFLAQQESMKIARELELPEEDSLYQYSKSGSKVSNNTLENLESSLKSHPDLEKLSFMGKLMGYANRGKFQFYISFVLMATGILAYAIFYLPFQFLKKLYKKLKVNK